MKANLVKVPFSKDTVICTKKSNISSYFSDVTKYIVIVYFTGLLLLFGAYLAWETRKVHISALNDSKLIGLSVYNVIIPCILVIPILGVVFDQPTIQFALTSFLTLFCTTFTLCFIFVPKVSESV